MLRSSSCAISDVLYSGRFLLWSKVSRRHLRSGQLNSDAYLISYSSPSFADELIFNHCRSLTKLVSQERRYVVQDAIGDTNPEAILIKSISLLQRKYLLIAFASLNERNFFELIKWIAALA